MQSWRVLPPPPGVLCADWLGLSLGPVGVGSRSFLTEPPVRGVVVICGDSGAILGAEDTGAPIAEGGVGAGVEAGAAGADNFGAAGAADFDWATASGLMAVNKITMMLIRDINSLLDCSQIARTMDCGRALFWVMLEA